MFVQAIPEENCLKNECELLDCLALLTTTFNFLRDTMNGSDLMEEVLVNLVKFFDIKRGHNFTFRGCRKSRVFKSFRSMEEIVL